MAAPAKAAARSDVPVDYWRSTKRPLEFGRERFRFFRYRGNVVARIDSLVTAASWDDVDTILRGSITLTGKWTEQHIAKGDVIRCEAQVVPGGRWAEVWTMRVGDLGRSIRGEAQASLADDLELLNLSQDDFRYVRDKAHPKGWLVHEVVADIAGRYGIPIGGLPKTKHRILNLTAKGTSPLAVIIDAFKRERTATGNRYFMRMRGGKLWITPLRRSSVLMEFGRTIVDGALQLTASEEFATVVTARASASDTATSKKAKLEVRVTRPSLTAKMGTVHRILVIPDADSLAELRSKALRKLAENVLPKREFSFSHAGIPGVRRGQALRIRLSMPGLSQVVFVREVSHTVGPGAYEMAVTCTFTDPYVDDKAKRDADARADAAAGNGRAVDDAAAEVAPPAPAKAANRVEA